VKRLAASVAVAGREREFSGKRRRAALLATVSGYRTAMRTFAGMSNLDVWYARVDAEQLLQERRSELDPGMARRAAADLAKARTRDRLRAFSKLTEIVDGEPRIVSDPPLIVPIEELAPGAERGKLEAWLRAMFRDYEQTLAPDRRRLLEQYRLAHFARKVVGVGSVGTQTWIALLVGRDVGDPLFLQLKEAEASVLAPFVGHSHYDNQAERVVTGQRLMQAAGDAFLGWERVQAGLDGRPHDFYVRQLHDWKGSANLDRIRARGLAEYGRMCGWTLARAHARSGERIAIASYLGSASRFDEAVAAFAETYADQNERDYAALVDAVAAGRLEATPGL
jgi:uncharacterized protein (DUF2252 family)